MFRYAKHAGYYISYDGGFTFPDYRIIFTDCDIVGWSGPSCYDENNTICIYQGSWAKNVYGCNRSVKGFRFLLTKDGGVTWSASGRKSNYGSLWNTEPIFGKWYFSYHNPARYYVSTITDPNDITTNFLNTFAYIRGWNYPWHQIAYRLTLQDGSVILGLWSHPAHAGAYSRSYRTTDMVTLHNFVSLPSGTYSWGIFQLPDGNLAMYGGQYNGESGVWYGSHYTRPRNGGKSWYMRMKIGHNIQTPNDNIDTCRAACKKDPYCCVFVYWEGCCNLRSTGCYQRHGLGEHEYMCTTSQSDPGSHITSGAGNCADWCANKPRANTGCDKNKTSCNSKQAIRNLPPKLARALNLKTKNVCKKNMPILNNDSLTDLLRVEANARLAVKRRKGEKMTPAQRKAFRVNMLTNLRRVYRNLMKKNNINIEYVRPVFVRRLFKNNPSANRRMLLASELYDEIEYVAGMNTSEAEDQEEAEEMIVAFVEAVNNPDMEQLVNDLNNDTDWTDNGNEDPLVLEETINEGVNEDETIVEYQVGYDPNDPKYCQWTVEL